MVFSDFVQLMEIKEIIRYIEFCVLYDEGVFECLNLFRY